MGTRAAPWCPGVGRVPHGTERPRALDTGPGAAGGCGDTVWHCCLPPLRHGQATAGVSPTLGCPRWAGRFGVWGPCRTDPSWVPAKRHRGRSRRGAGWLRGQGDIGGTRGPRGPPAPSLLPVPGPGPRGGSAPLRGDGQGAGGGHPAGQAARSVPSGHQVPGVSSSRLPRQRTATSWGPRGRGQGPELAALRPCPQQGLRWGPPGRGDRAGGGCAGWPQPLAPSPCSLWGALRVPSQGKATKNHPR